MDLKKTVREILEDIETNGFSAVQKYSTKFDNYDGELTLSEAQWQTAQSVSEYDKEVVDRIAKRLTAYHERQKGTDDVYRKGDSLFGLVTRPIRRVGIYVPGGKPLPSTLLMTLIPAKIAGVNEIVVCTPPKDGTIHPLILYIAEKFGIS